LRYVEPFAGGAGVALRLVFDEYVDEVVLNDLNPGVAAFWRCVFTRTDDLVERVRTCEPSLEEWHWQRAIYGSGTRDDLALGFATFFLNRTNHSGILDARPIGGLAQTGKWGIAARFDRASLAARIETLGRYRSRVVVCAEDGIDLIARHLGDCSSFIYADPPYLVHGDDLYLDTLRWSDHERLAGLLRAEERGWLLTYDADPRVTENLYVGMRCAQFQTSHTAAVQHVGQEYAVFPRGLKIASLKGLGSGEAQYIVA
jgi:DNA adenine methylase